MTLWPLGCGSWVDCRGRRDMLSKKVRGGKKGCGSKKGKKMFSVREQKMLIFLVEHFAASLEDGMGGTMCKPICEDMRAVIDEFTTCVVGGSTTQEILGEIALLMAELVGCYTRKVFTEELGRNVTSLLGFKISD